MIKVAVNGFGRIGKSLTKVILKRHDMEVVAINDLADLQSQAHLFKYDSIHGRFVGEITTEENKLIIDGRSIKYSSEADVNHLDWRKANVDLVIESTGHFTSKAAAGIHLQNGAPKVIISAPSKDESVKTILVGINDSSLSPDDLIVSNASCTTNSAGPLIKILDDHCGIESAYITTVHSYTGDQRLHDSPHRDLRRARAGALSIIPTSTGAAKAITRIFPHLEGHMGGCGIRVPVPNGSLTDISCVVKNPMSIADINKLFRSYAEGSMQNILEYTEDPLVSVDIIGNSHSCVFDAQLTSVLSNMIKVVGWYDNEVGYAHRLADLIKLMA
jgi:glyceraldehyde 3-phosphate dehydrogenase